MGGFQGRLDLAFLTRAAPASGDARAAHPITPKGEVSDQKPTWRPTMMPSMSRPSFFVY